MTPVFAPIIAMLHNVKADKWHPILFLAHPIGPMGDAENGATRYKSKGHHTVGFDSRDAADENAKTKLVEHVRDGYGSEPLLCLQKAFPWDGEDIPAMVTFFARNSAGEIVPVM